MERIVAEYIAPNDHQEVAGPLLPADRTQDLRTGWDQIQTGFVDEPRKAV